MSQQYLAQCPHCSATFKVKDQHLNAAGGKVRCGSCMQVFNAREQLEEKGVLETDNKQTVIERALQTQQTKQPASEPDYKNYASHLTDEAAIQKEEEEFVFEDNPEDDAEDQSYTGKSSNFEDDLDTSFLDMSTTRAHQFNDVLNEDSMLDVVEDASSDESWAEKMLEDSAEEEKKAQEPSFASKSKGQRIEPSFSIMEDEPEEKETLRPAPAPAVIKSSASAQKPAQKESGHSPYHSLKVEPIAARSTNNRAGTMKAMIWTILAMLLAVALTGQFAWHNFDKFVQYPQLRPLYAIACNVLDCTLPDLADISKIKSQNLVVRSHPTVKNSLIIDAIIINKAEFEQPFPRLGLHFSDINNKIVAEKIFAPDEYLSGDARGMNKMPANTPVRLIIEIKDPGTDAVNYTISFHKAAKG